MNNIKILFYKIRVSQVLDVNKTSELKEYYLSLLVLFR